MNASPIFHSALVGRVYHIISKDDHLAKCDSKSKKRPRPWFGCDAKGSVDKRSFDPSSSNFRKGFIFVPEKKQSNGSQSENLMHLSLDSLYQSQGDGLPIVIPYPSLREACYAAANGKLVRISQYSLIRYSDGWGALIFSSRFDANTNAFKGMQSGCADNFVAIEVHHDGLCIVSSANEEEFEKQSSRMYTMPSMNLDALAQKETEMKLSSGPKGTKKRSIGKDPINVTGVVDAISPILVNDFQGEPFAIMELYQPLIGKALGTNVKTAVAVIRGEDALCIHPALHPGQSIALTGVISRRWKVPDEFQKHLHDVDEVAANGTGLYQRLNHRVPNRVLWVAEASAISWNGEDQLVRSLDMALPSTVESLTSIRGVVTSVNYHRIHPKDDTKAGEHRYIAHFVTLKLLTPTEDASPKDRLTSTDQVFCVDKDQQATNEQKLTRIYLPKYAMSPNLTLGLQTGSIIRAVNIHFIPPSTKKSTCEFVACLRSTIAIERCAGESPNSERSLHPWFVPKGEVFSLVPDHLITEICSDPFNTKSSDQYFAEENFRRELESKLRSYEPLDLAEHAQQPISNSVRCDSKSSDEQRYFQNSICDKVDALLVHHHRVITLGKLDETKDQRRECDCMKRNSGRINDGHNRWLTVRDPYAEFFDHAHNGSFSTATECGSSINEFSFYNHYFYHMASTSMPHVAGLEDLRNSCAQNFINRVAISLQCIEESSRISSGWTSSYHYQGLSMIQVLNDYKKTQSLNNAQSKVWYDVSNDSTNNIYAWGHVEANIASQEFHHTTASFRDNACQIPFSLMPSESFQTFQLEKSDSFIWLQIESMSISCLCLGLRQREHASGPGDCSSQVNNEKSHKPGSCPNNLPHSFLPSTKDGDIKAGGTDGHGFVFLVDNLVFIASVHITAKSIASIDHSDSLRAKAEDLRALHKPRGLNEPPSSITDDTSVLSVQECLEQTTSLGQVNSPVSIVGRMLRQRFTFRKLKTVLRAGGSKKCYEGWSIILSHIEPSSGDILGAASVLQTIEVRISVTFGMSIQTSSNALKYAVHRLFSSGAITPDQVTMGLAWWVASENSKTLPLLAGGWDERDDNFSVDKNFLPPSVHLMIPYKSRTFSNLGYQRFRCDLDEINSFLVSEPECSHKLFHERSNHKPLLRATAKFLPGMLVRRLIRVPPMVSKVAVKKDFLYGSKNQHSLLTKLKGRGGVPSATLAELHWEICNALKDGSHAHLKPSLLRRIHNAKILSISFCRARVECTQCFKTLSGGTSKYKRFPTMHRRHDSPSNFWLSEDKESPEASTLYCPSGCSRSHGAVKWECSAIIDDGTGQAKMYAEREAALLLLGRSLDVATIEKGVWELDGGLFFQPALPASSHLVSCIKDASSRARQFITDSRVNKKEKDFNANLASTFSLLPADAKAEYLLHQHCRQWYQQHHCRKMDLFCRCKPLSEDVKSVNQSEIQVAKAWIARCGLVDAKVPTATLPPLKLTLEDACLTSEEGCDDNATGW
eukprot:CAMPEP_0181081368 /NCGR_PEP_ID=MMETSP1071-20121207/3065_1 /TAXON_ID=35127 /ORGANISM="Thalassiosira sp., Strain NH16" /LENGTH=1499 /DNA_ID=CAMNT_0023162911 /DNA_START=189 /DNA_END=4685 /DNA_ORIENTATION=+